MITGDCDVLPAAEISKIAEGKTNNDQPPNALLLTNGVGDERLRVVV